MMKNIFLFAYNVGGLKLALVYGKMVAELFVQYGNLYYQMYAVVAIIIFVLIHGCMNMLINELKEDLKEEENNN